MKIDLEELKSYLDENSVGKSLGDVATALGGGIFPSGASPVKHPLFKKLAEKISSSNGSENFVSRLFFYIKQKGKRNSEVYNAAGMTPDCFSKIISGKTKNPKKRTVLSLAFALSLNLDEAEDLLSSAGFSLYKDKEDLIYRFCFENGPFTLDEVNEALVYFKCKALGGND